MKNKIEILKNKIIVNSYDILSNEKDIQAKFNIISHSITYKIFMKKREKIKKNFEQTSQHQINLFLNYFIKCTQLKQISENFSNNDFIFTTELKTKIMSPEIKNLYNELSKIEKEKIENRHKEEQCENLSILNDVNFTLINYIILFQKIPTKDKIIVIENLIKISNQ